ncbi:MAG: hypothetical protein GX329_00680 [Tissierellia bacterium]|nr:hypothetical protein [Tissierellia bacterium]
MLKDVLREINDSDYISKANIAIKLNRTEGLIEDAFSQLIRMGYIIEDKGVNNCNISCGNCPLARSCNKEFITSIAITEKGYKLLQK